MQRNIIAEGLIARSSKQHSNESSLPNNLSDQYDLTQAGLEEYNTRNALSYEHQSNQLFHHQKQSSYAQSEGYHSYVSSTDSNSVTPFLDRLRQESELLSHQTRHWQENDNAVEQACGKHQNNYSESTSSTETLKWLGSMNDDSEGDYTECSAISESVSTSKLIAHSARVMTPKRYRSDSVLSQGQKPVDSSTSTSPSEQQLKCHQHCSSDPSIHTKLIFGASNMQDTFESGETTISSIYDTSIESYPVKGEFLRPLPSTNLNEFQPKENNNLPTVFDIDRSVNLTAPSASSEISQPTTNESSKFMNFQTELVFTSSRTLNSLANNTLKRMSLSSSGSINIEPLPNRNNYRLFPVNTYTDSLNSNIGTSISQEKKTYCTVFEKLVLQQNDCKSINNKLQYNKDRMSPLNPQSWQSVAELINDFERGKNQPSQKYTFLEPSKTHRVSNSSLKAFQKTAVQSYFERQKQQHLQEQTKNTNVLSDEQKLLLRPQSLRVSSNLSNFSGQTRNSLPDNLNLPQLSSSMYFKEKEKNQPELTGEDQFDMTSLRSSSPEPPLPPPRSRSLMSKFIRRSSCEYTPTNIISQPESQEKLSEPFLRSVSCTEKMSFNVCGMPTSPPPPPPRKLAMSLGYPSMSMADQFNKQKAKLITEPISRTQYYNFIANSSADNLDHKTNFWVPERPPKNPNMRVPSPELPPPPPDMDTNLSDEPLPPPPPEVLQTENIFVKDSLLIRRNSLNATPSNSFERSNLTASNKILKIPPKIPKKPITLKKEEVEPINLNNRKRSHNTMQMNQHTTSSKISNASVLAKHDNTMKLSPPPLLPKNVNSSSKNDPHFYSKYRCHTKSSYLPKQSFEKVCHSHTDHGSYKLMIDSHEKNVATKKEQSEILASKINARNVLPDVLPVSAKQEVAVPSAAKTSVSTQKEEQKEHLNYFDVKILSPVNNVANNTENAQLSLTNNDKRIESLSLKSIQSIDSNLLTITPSSISKLENINDLKQSNSYKADISSAKLQTDNNIINEICNEIDKCTFAENSGVTLKKSVECQGSLKANNDKITELQAKLLSTHIEKDATCSTLENNNNFCATVQNDEMKNVIDAEINCKSRELKTIKENCQIEDKIEDKIAAAPSNSQEYVACKISKSTLNDQMLRSVSKCTQSIISSQTGAVGGVHHNKNNSLMYNSRQRETIETDYDTLAEELLKLLPPHDKLIYILNPIVIKTSLDYTSNLYNPNIILSMTEKDVAASTLVREDTIDTQEQLEHNEVFNICRESDQGDMDVVKKKLVNLISTTNKILKLLKIEEAGIIEETARNDSLGSTLKSKILEKVLPSENTKIQSYIDDIGHITSLLLSLAERLAKTENSLVSIIDNNLEKIQLERKRQNIKEQLMEAKQLKDVIDHRGVFIKGLLEKNLTSEEFADFNFFINMKAKLIFDVRGIAVKIKFREEQLCALRESLLKKNF